MSTTIDDPTSTTSENLEENPSCFVCGNRVNGLYFTLATIQTHTSKTRIVEKISDLIGEKFMVIISEEDVICRSCTNLINTLDRLQNETKSISNVVLTFLEKKYSLDDGELSKPEPKSVQENETYLARKKRQLEEEYRSEMEQLEQETNKTQNSNMWMQCDKCQYTTQYNAYMVHHIRQHIKTALPSGTACNNIHEDINQNIQHSVEIEPVEKVHKSISKRQNFENSTHKLAAKTRRVSETEIIQAERNNQASSTDVQIFPSSEHIDENQLFEINDIRHHVIVQNIDGVYMQVNSTRDKIPLEIANEVGVKGTDPS